MQPNRFAKLRSRIWDTHSVLVEGETKRSAFGTTHGNATEVKASVTVSERVVKDLHGNDVLVAATIRWAPSGPIPHVGDKITLPEYFPVKGRREVITSGLVVSGTGLTPDHVEVTVK
ncbi:hypothetical protein CPHO_08335 [Corynebacterium phocae]|uniref:Phage protein n=1 Tax=Corynebacterium phocae TaxID=161895 RepID=A0A1L7D4Q0_9CORY|nr:hypothetical protein [Corynebacterium phocae]APT92892.1 hypothetical protein CPHO_08335 [Corynebacterium phocae]KAA8723214.1 hypothetical protein F4V58_07830 [Corynebacterium phocae]